MEKDLDEPPNDRLWVIEQKLLSLGHLIGQQNTNNTLPMPDDMEAINKGLEMLITDLALEMADIRGTIEEAAAVSTTRRSKKTPLSVIESEP